MSKTEANIMEAAKRTGVVCITVCDGKGVREMNALLSLISAGKLVRIPEACGSERDYTRNKSRRTIYLHTVGAKLAA